MGRVEEMRDTRRQLPSKQPVKALIYLSLVGSSPKHCCLAFSPAQTSSRNGGTTTRGRGVSIIRPRIQSFGQFDRRMTRLRQQQQSNDDQEWKVGDVYRDLDRLEQAIALTNAEQDLEHQERVETMDYIAQQRRLVRPDLQKYVAMPFAVSVIIFVLLKTLPGLRPFLNTISSLHFWSLVVVAPILLLVVKESRQDALPSIPSDLEGLDPEYYRFISNWEDPSQSTRDYILCLLEQWASAVTGMALFGAWLPTLRTGSRWIVRLAAWASLHQYPKLWFQLNRKQQPRPLSWPVWSLQRLVGVQSIQWFVATDLALCLSYLKASFWTWILGFGSLACFLALLDSRPALLPKLGQWRKPVSRMFLALAVLTWSHTYRYAICILKQPLRIGLSLGTLALPLCHLRAIQRLFRFMYTHNASLALDDFWEQSQDKHRIQWRYRLVWREPQRVKITFDRYRRRLSYWLFYEGSVDDQLFRDFQRRQKNELKQSDESIWQRLAREKEYRNKEAQQTDRSQWKENAMNRLKYKHELDYERGTYEDPLGLAVYRSLGIGLGFNFDHTTKLRKNETPNTRRLQARAAKSAVKRVQEIYNAPTAKKELDTIRDLTERNKKAQEMRNDTKKEIQYLANRLVELIPTDLVLDGTGGRLEMFGFPSSYKRISSHEFVLLDPRQPSDILGGLLKMPDKPPDDDIPDYLNPSGEPSSSNSDDEFIDAWEKAQLLRLGNQTDDQSDDDDMKIVLA